ncbi:MULTISPECIES: DnaJ domain-containing protein [unclassified Wolbachia]|uniref:DnaJ domain-containing protein n=1 Tax=unclassified Wolbachia TaxID=2640676 RepID=UPI001FE95EBC|nr:DnaJ domain-containing protein [Wolbachia endosymbiont of Cardiocondyla obscurior]
MNRKEALEVLDLNANPSEREITIAYRKLALKYHPDKHSGKSKDVQKQNEEKFKELGAAYECLTVRSSKIIAEMTDEEFEDVMGMSDERFDMFMKKTMQCCMKNLDEINSADDLSSSLSAATLGRDVEYLKKLFSKFKSSKNGQFGDYINKSYAGVSPLTCAILSQNIEIVELFLKNGADPNTNIYGFLNIHKSEAYRNKVEKLLVEYGRIDKSSVFCQLALAVLTSYVAFAIYSSCDASFVCYAGVAAFALAGVLLVAKAIHDVFYVQTKWPSPNFDEVNAEQVINSQEQGAAGSSRNVWV